MTAETKLTTEIIREKLWEKFDKKGFCRLVGLQVSTVTNLESVGILKKFTGKKFLVEILNEIRSKQFSVFQYASVFTQRRLKHICDLAFQKNPVVAKSETTEIIKTDETGETGETMKKNKRGGTHIPAIEQMRAKIDTVMTLGEFSQFLGYGENFIKNNFRQFLPPNGAGQRRKYTLRKFLSSLLPHQKEIKEMGHIYMHDVLDMYIMHFPKISENNEDIEKKIEKSFRDNIYEKLNTAQPTPPPEPPQQNKADVEKELAELTKAANELKDEIVKQDEITLRLLKIMELQTELLRETQSITKQHMLSLQGL